MKKFLSIILAVVMIASLLPAAFMTASAEDASATLVAGDNINYVFAHGAHTSTASNKGTVGTNLADVGFDDMVSSVSSGAWGNKTYRTSERDGLRSGALAVHKTGDFINISLTPATRNFENTDATATKGFFKFDTPHGSSGNTLPIALIRIDVPADGIYAPSITMLRGLNNGQQFKVYLIKETAEVQAMTAAQVRASLSEADAIGNFDSCVGGEQALSQHALNDSAYLIAIVPNGMSANSNPANISSEIGLQPKSFKLTYVSPLPDELSSIALSADKTSLELGGEGAKLSVKGTYTRSGERTIANTDVAFSASPSGVVSVSADGSVYPIGEGKAIVTATYEGKTSSVSFDVAVPAPFEHEYIFTLSAFNKDKMIKGASSTASATETVPYYGAEAVLHPTEGNIYYRTAMHWNYTVPAAFSATGEAFPAMNLSATDPWAFEATRVNLGSPRVQSDGYFFEYARNSYLGATPSFVAFRLKVMVPGTYDISVLSSNRQNDSPIPAVYFFKAGTAGVTTSDVSTYPADAKLGYYDLYNALKRYKTVGESVRIPEAGEYIIAFVGDAKSYEKSTVIGTDQQRFYLSGIKLTPVAEPENPNAAVAYNQNFYIAAVVGNDGFDADATSLITSDDIAIGSVASKAVGSSVTLKAEDSEDLKFLYWYNGNSKRILSDLAEYTFKVGTKAPIYAKYIAAGETLTEYFNAAGELITEAEGTFASDADLIIGGYELYKETTVEATYDAVTKTSTSDNFVCWTKDGKVVSYDKSYTYYPWTGDEEVVEVTEGEKSSVPSVVLFKNGNSYMLELVNCEGVEIVEKGILFSQSGTPTVDSCYAKAVSAENKTQFAASSEYANARAYVLYRDGAYIRVAYSK